MINAILFDWDKTLGRPLGDVSDEERLLKLIEKGQKTFLKPKKFNHSAEEIEVALKKRKNRIEKGECDGELYPQHREDLILFYQQILAEIGYGRISDELADELRQSYAELPFELYPDTIPTLSRLTDLGFKLGIITNNSVRVKKVILKEVGKYIYSDAITISDEVDIYKPNGEIFKIGAKRLGVNPEACIYVGDDRKIDALAACENGGYYKSFWLNREKKKPKDELPIGVYEISDLSELISHI